MQLFRILVLDTNAIINLKKLPIRQQWSFFKKAERLVESGHIVFPRQVHQEISRVKHPDAPGVWAAGIASSVRQSDPREETLKKVLEVASDMLDPNSEKDLADPYVVAMALELQGGGKCQVSVVSDDKVDHSGLTSVATACNRLSVPCIGVDEFILWVMEQGLDSQPDLFSG